MEIEDRELAELVVGRGTEADVTAATLNRIEAEIRLRKARSSRETTDVSALQGPTERGRAEARPTLE